MQPQDRPVVLALLALAGALTIHSLAGINPAILPNWLNSNLVTSLIGAFAGAYGGQLIVERSKAREELLREVRITNAAIILAFGICNTSLSLKKQHVKALKETFDNQRKALEQAQEQRSRGEPAIFELHADFETIQPISVETEVLRTQIFEKLSVGGRPIGTLTALIASLRSLNDALMKRNEFIEAFQKQSPHLPEVLIATYFGLPTWNGNVDRRYPAYVEAIHSHTDDCIFFSRVLAEDLVEHGLRLKQKWEKRHRVPCPKINRPDFKNGEKLGLFPDSSYHEEWLTMFVKHEENN